MEMKVIKAFKLTNCTGAYWRGDADNKMLCRVYGIAFPKASMLEDYLNMLEEAKKRDHNKLGRELELFTTVDYIGQGLPILCQRVLRLSKSFKDLLRMRRQDVVGSLQKLLLWQRAIYIKFQVTGTIIKRVCSF